MELIIALVAIAIIGIAIYTRNNRAEVKEAEQAPYKVEAPKVEAVNAQPVAQVKQVATAKAKVAPKATAKAKVAPKATAKPKAAPKANAPAKPRAKKPAAPKAAK